MRTLPLDLTNGKVFSDLRELDINELVGRDAKTKSFFTKMYF